MSIEIIPRSAWGARAPRSRVTVSWAGLRTLWVHHSEGTVPGDDIAEEKAVVRGIQNFHMDDPKHQWRDIGYAFLIAPSGRIYEGRGVGVDAAHCPGHNGEPSVCLLGKYQSVPPSEAARRAVWALADHLGLSDLNGHRQGFSTSCPGDATMRTLVDAPRPPKEPIKPQIAHANTLRLAIRTAADIKAGRPGRRWAGTSAGGALAWVAKHGVAPTSTVALAYKGNVWRNRRDARNVARNLTKRFSF